MELRVRRYFEYLTASDTAGVVALFAPDATVTSPFLGEMPAGAFFARLEDASGGSRLTVHDVLVNLNGPSAAARFRYEWTLKDGSETEFEGVDYFRFDRSGRFSAMLIYYDTHPLRAEVGDKYR